MTSALSRRRSLLAYLWALPCSLVGLLLALPILLFGGGARRTHGTLEVSYRPVLATCRGKALTFPYRAITFGHVILAITAEELQRLGPHERAHVRQYERWGLFFFPAYLGSSAWQYLRGRDPYWENHFEVQARRDAPPVSSA